MMDSSFLTEERRQSMGKDAWAKEEQRVEAWIRSRTGSCEKPWLAAVIHHPVYGMHDGIRCRRRSGNCGTRFWKRAGSESFSRAISTCISERDPFMGSCI